jgi:hypothetical protein
MVQVAHLDKVILHMLSLSRGTVFDDERMGVDGRMCVRVQTYPVAVPRSCRSKVTSCQPTSFPTVNTALGDIVQESNEEIE